MGLLTPFAKGHVGTLFQMAREAAESEQRRYDALADHLTVSQLATEIAGRMMLSHDDAAQLVGGIVADGGGDPRTREGAASVAAILGVPGAPIHPALH